MYDCIYHYADTGSTTPQLLASSTCSVATSTVPSVATTTDIAFFNYMTAGEIFISLLLLTQILWVIFIATVRALDRVKTKRTFMQYSGGDVEIDEIV